jgi:hypothetical protein
MIKDIHRRIHSFFERLKVFLFYYPTLGSIRIKDESLAPPDWRKTLWDKFKNDEFFQPINLRAKEHFKEYKIFINGKVVVFAVNIFLFSFSISLLKNTYNIVTADYKLYNIHRVNFEKYLPKNLILEEKQKKIELAYYEKLKDQKETNKIKNELTLANKWKQEYTKLKKDEYRASNVDAIKSNLWSFLNDIFVLFMMSKYFSKKKD